NPTVPRIFGLRFEKGFFDLLADPGLDLADIMLQTNFKNLAIIPGGSDRGHGPSESTELLASARMSALMDEIAQRHDNRIVIFDAAPVLASSEPGTLALHVGQIVLVVEAEQTSRRTVEEALGLLQGCPNINLVLNKARAWLGEDQFGAYYGYGSS